MTERQPSELDPPPGRSTGRQTTRLAALQAALAGEHAAVWACGRAAGELAGEARTAALGELDKHRAARDRLRRLVEAEGAEPFEAAPAYVEPFPVRGAKAARRLLGHVNQALVATYADLAAAAEPAGRGDAIDAATAAAVRAIEWGAAAEAFPGEGP